MHVDEGGVGDGADADFSLEDSATLTRRQRDRSVYTKHVQVPGKGRPNLFKLGGRLSSKDNPYSAMDMTMEHAEATLGGSAPRENGAFLFRRSTAGGGAVVLSMLWQHHVHHFVLKYLLKGAVKDKKINAMLKKVVKRFKKSTDGTLPGLLTDYVGNEEAAVPPASPGADAGAGAVQLRPRQKLPPPAHQQPLADAEYDDINGEDFEDANAGGANANRDSVLSVGSCDSLIYSLDPVYDDFDGVTHESGTVNYSVPVKADPGYASPQDALEVAAAAASDKDTVKDALQDIYAIPNKTQKKAKQLPPQLPPPLPTRSNDTSVTDDDGPGPGPAGQAAVAGDGQVRPVPAPRPRSSMSNWLDTSTLHAGSQSNAGGAAAEGGSQGAEVGYEEIGGSEDDSDDNDDDDGGGGGVLSPRPRLVLERVGVSPAPRSPRSTPLSPSPRSSPKAPRSSKRPLSGFLKHVFGGKKEAGGGEQAAVADDDGEGGNRPISIVVPADYTTDQGPLAAGDPHSAGEHTAGRKHRTAKGFKAGPRALARFPLRTPCGRANRAWVSHAPNLRQARLGRSVGR